MNSNTRHFVGMLKSKLRRESANRLLEIIYQTQFGLLGIVRLVSANLLVSVLDFLSIGALLLAVSALLQEPSPSGFPYSYIGQYGDITVIMFCGFGAATILSSAARYYLLRWQTIACFKLGAELTDARLHSHILAAKSDLNLLEMDKFRSDLLKRSDVVVKESLLPLFQIMSSAISLLVLYGCMFFIAPVLALVLSVTLVGGYALVYTLLHRKTHRISRDIDSINSYVVGLITTIAIGLKSLLVSGGIDAARDRFRLLEVDLRFSQAILFVYANAPRYLMEGLIILMVCCVVVFFEIAGAPREQYLPILAAFGLGGQRMIPLLQMTFGGIMTLRGNTAQINDFLSGLDQYFAQGRGTQMVEEVFTALRVLSIKASGEISLGDKSATQIDTEVEILPGSKIIVTGKSGVGKTTLLNTLIGLRHDKCVVTFGDMPVQKIKTALWQQSVYLDQDPFVPDGSVLDSLSVLSGQKVSIDDAREALRRAGIDYLAPELLEKNRIGLLGGNLSRGERQRIALSAIWLRKPNYIFLDEATNALPEDLESQLISGLHEEFGSATIVHVSHSKRIQALYNQKLEICDGYARLR